MSSIITPYGATGGGGGLYVKYYGRAKVSASLYNEDSTTHIYTAKQSTGAADCMVNCSATRLFGSSTEGSCFVNSEWEPPFKLTAKSKYGGFIRLYKPNNNLDYIARNMEKLSLDISLGNNKLDDADPVAFLSSPGDQTATSAAVKYFFRRMWQPFYFDENLSRTYITDEPFAIRWMTLYQYAHMLPAPPSGDNTNILASQRVCWYEFPLIPNEQFGFTLWVKPGGTEPTNCYLVITKNVFFDIFVYSPEP